MSEKEKKTMENEEIIELAKSCHEGWVKAKLANGYMYGAQTDDAAKTNANLVPWDDLPEEIKNSNINSAKKLKSLVNNAGFKFLNLTAGISALRDYAAKKIAKQLHLAWAKDKVEAGWTYAPITNKEAKQHRDLCVISGVCTYEEFLERYPEDAQYDIDTAYGMLSNLNDSIPVPEFMIGA